jgi:hypothetical protein
MSLMVEDVDTCPKPVGVVHARSETFALAIAELLRLSGATE